MTLAEFVIGYTACAMVWGLLSLLALPLLSPARRAKHTPGSVLFSAAVWPCSLVVTVVVFAFAALLFVLVFIAGGVRALRGR